MEFPSVVDIEKPIVYVNAPSTPTIGVSSPLNWRGRDRPKEHSTSPSIDREIAKPRPPSLIMTENHSPLQSNQTPRTPTSAANQLREMERVAQNESVRGGLVGFSKEEMGSSELKEEDSIEEESAPFPPQEESMSIGASSLGAQDYPQPMMIDTREYSQPSSRGSSAGTPNGSSNPSSNPTSMHSGSFSQGGSVAEAMAGRKTPRTPGTRRSTPVASSAIAEFDPFVPIPTDWMMSFESPQAFQAAVQAAALASYPNSPFAAFPRIQQQQHQHLHQQHPSSLTSPPPSLLDALSNDFVTPNSQVRFSQRDVDDIKQDLTAKFEKEFELAQLEIQDLEAKRAKATEQQKEFQSTLAEWEQAMKTMIAEREKEQQRTASEMEQLKLQADKYREERDRCMKENEVVLLKYKQLRIDFEDLKESEGKLKEQTTTLQSEVGVLEKRYETLKDHAEQKLESANVEIARVRQGYEKEISALKAKLSRSEVQIKTLERTVESKNVENAELAKVWDVLLAEADGQMTSAC
ncbi:Transforming acidic coiled-coil-containing protein 3 [Rhizophlyctis rosea]|uniref:Transforming acidic coiled-coil-containing protein 3 n=1 Tax=Rhizophlyctis rosea TaxID=64517 RepID=A0AAD5X5G9_9FUNG|nr:Transforming acidic coiled-coil-containing protein 3 [Rhizophlyctis rosea]